MERFIFLYEAGQRDRPVVVVTQKGATIGEGDNVVKLTPEQWNLLVDKIKSEELTPIKEIADDQDDCDCC